MRFNTGKDKRTKFKIPVGIWKNGNKFEFSWITRSHQVCSLTVSPKQLQNIEKVLLKETRTTDETLSDSAKIRYEFSYISALPPHLIWSKSVILPGNPTAPECEQFCQFTLNKDLPFPIDDVHFDYRKKPLGNEQSTGQSSQIDIFAVHKDTVQDYVNSLTPIKIEVLDHSAYCLLRTLKVLESEHYKSNVLWIYYDYSGYILLREKRSQLQVMQQAGGQDLDEIIKKFIARYSDRDEQYIAVSDNNLHKITIPDYVRVIPMPVPSIAFGCALWGEDQKIAEELNSNIVLKPILMAELGNDLTGIFYEEDE